MISRNRISVLCNLIIVINGILPDDSMEVYDCASEH
jgi:hypothetical protein